MTTKFILGVLTVCATVASTVYAGPAERLLLDRGENGLISLDEAQSDPHVSALFVDLDINGDGMIDRAELSRFETVAQARKIALEPACLKR